MSKMLPILNVCCYELALSPLPAMAISQTVVTSELNLFSEELFSADISDHIYFPLKNTVPELSQLSLCGSWVVAKTKMHFR